MDVFAMKISLIFIQVNSFCLTFYDFLIKFYDFPLLFSGRNNLCSVYRSIASPAVREGRSTKKYFAGRFNGRPCFFYLSLLPSGRLVSLSPSLVYMWCPGPSLLISLSTSSHAGGGGDGAFSDCMLPISSHI